jgi:hypothetical protein
MLLFLGPYFIFWQRQKIFSETSRPALGPTQPPSRLTGTGFHTREKSGRDVTITTFLHLVTRLRMSVAVPPLSLHTHLLAIRGLVLRGFANWQGRPKIKVHHPNPSVDRSIGTVRQLHQVFEPNRVMFEEWKGRREVGPFTTFLQRKEKH